MNFLKGLWDRLSGKKRNIGGLLILVVQACRHCGVDLPDQAEDIAMKIGEVILLIGVIHAGAKRKK